MSNSFSKTFLLSVSLAAAGAISVYNFYTKKKKIAGNEVQKKKIPRKEVHEVIFFSHGVVELRKSKYSRCMITASIDRLLYHLDSPKYTLDICIYVLTNLDLANAVQKLTYRGVKVRIIIDADMAFSSGSNIRRLQKHGIPVRWMKSPNLMHHKFCLIDASTDNPQVTPAVMTGSLNWTNQALDGNYENILVTSQDKLVGQFKEEFERLWVMFKPIVDFV